MKYGVLIDHFAMNEIPSGILKNVYQYWLDMKGEREMPSRADLNPADITNLLPYIMLVDVEQQPRRYRYRLVGTETVKAMGYDVTGQYLDELPLVEKHVKIRSDWLVKEKSPYMFFDKLKWSNRSLLDYQTIALPLSANGEDVTMFFLGMHYQFPGDERTTIYPIRSK